MKVSQTYGGRFLKADAMEGDLTLTITGCRKVTFEDGTSTWALTFTECDKMLALNATNANTVAQLFGDDSEAWPGNRIELFKSITEMAGKPLDCIRVRLPSDADSSAVDI